MMNWNEETLRRAASWKAFKEGAALFQAGLVTDAAATPGGWRGTVRSGKRPLRVNVTVRSASDLETRCACPENQASGAFCCHAVAAGLAVVQATAGTAVRAPAKIETAADVPISYEVTLTPNWPSALTKGKLAASLTPVEQVPPQPADSRLRQWLAGQKSLTGGPLHLQLSGNHLAGFVDCLIDHPRVSAGPQRQPIRTVDGVRLPIEHCSLEGDRVRLMPGPLVSGWILTGGRLIRAAENAIEIAGTGALPASLADHAGELAAGRAAIVPLHGLLENLPSWQEWLEFPADGWLAGLHFLPAPARYHLALDGSLKLMRATLRVCYENSDPVPPSHGLVPSLPLLSADRCLLRDQAGERIALQSLQSAGFQAEDPAAGTWTLTGEESVLQFLAHTLPTLREQWQVSESPQFVRETAKVTIAAPHIEILDSGDDWLIFDFNFQTTDGNSLSGDDMRRLLRSGGQHQRLAGGRHLLVDEDVGGVLQPLLGELDLVQENGHYRASKAAISVVFEIQKYLHNTQNYNEEDKHPCFHIPASLRADLRPYQLRGCAWLADRLNRFGGALLADDMGLGKTIQAIVLIEHLFDQPRLQAGAAAGQVLVVATTSLLGNWRAEIARFAPGRRVRILHGASRDDEREQVQPGEVLVTSYGTLVRDLAWHLRRDYLAVVADEASLMRNPDTDHARAMAKLRSPHRIALSGTPVENSVRDIWSIFRFIQPGWLGERADFRERYESPLAQHPPPQAPLQRLRLKTAPFILRRTKEQVAPELPAKLEIDEFCDLSPDQWSVYRELMAEGRRQVYALSDAKQTGAAKMRILTTLLRLRQTCCDLALLGNERLSQLPHSRRSAKIERLMELLQEAIDSNHRVLIFSQFQKQLLEIEKSVSKAGWDSLRLDGQTRNRQELVEKFQHPAGPSLFLISLKAGGYGLNLTAADTVIHFDPWWNPAAEAQATDRAHRIGQTRPVTVYRLLTRGTVEEKVVRLQSRKRGIARAIDEAGGGEPPAGMFDDPEQLRRLFEA